MCELTKVAGRILFTSLRLIFQVAFSLSSTHFKGTKIPKEYKKHSPSLVPKLWLSASTINDFSTMTERLRHLSLLPTLPQSQLELLSFLDCLILGMSQEGKESSDTGNTKLQWTFWFKGECFTIPELQCGGWMRQRRKLTTAKAIPHSCYISSLNISSPLETQPAFSAFYIELGILSTLLHFIVATTLRDGYYYYHFFCQMRRMKSINSFI